jgi:hypothetical protein
VDQSLAVTYLVLALTGINALLPSGKLPATRVLPRISRFSRSIMVLVRMRRRRPAGWLSSGYVVVSLMPPRRRRAASPSFPDSISTAIVSALAGADSRGSMANTALRASAAHRVCLGLTLASTPAHGMHHAPLVASLWQQSADRIHQSGAPVAGRRAHARQATPRQRGDERVPAGGVLLRALGHADDLAVPVQPDADGHGHGDVLDRPAPVCFVKLLSADMACLVVRLSGWF